ncbi:MULTISPECIES: hypothetical protein [Bradyrhizobium]|uniref:Uncharacterized protein n=1 Tax=Bradyrhizobium septentrionale TaxID=1404411 RepID=A0ABZ2NVV3_9BRAD
MDFNEFGPSNTSPDTNSPLPPTDATGFEQQLNGAQGGAAPHRTASPALPGEPYSPYLDAGRHYSPYLDARHPYSPYLDIAQPYSPGLRWEDDSHAPAALGADPAPEPSPHHLSQQTIAQAIEAHPDFDQDLLWQDMDKNPSHAGHPPPAPLTPGLRTPDHLRLGLPKLYRQNFPSSVCGTDVSPICKLQRL